MKRRRKVDPAELTLNFRLPPSSGDTTQSYIDLNLAMSIANRRFYSQQYTPVVAGFRFVAPQGTTGNVVVSALPNTWPMKNAYVKSRALWEKMNDQVLDEEPSIQGKYADFKIYMDEDMTAQTIQCDTDPTGRILTPVDFNSNFTKGNYTGAGALLSDWNYSKLTIPNVGGSGTTVDYTMHAVGPDAAGSKGLIAGYEKSRSRPNNPDPNTPDAQGWMTDLFDVGEQLDELRDIIEDDNDRPPYVVGTSSTPYYPGGAQEFPTVQAHEVAIFSTTTVSGKINMSGLAPMCGLLRIDNYTDVTIEMQVILVPGTHRGYSCMEE